jgi:hypothetical protein
VQFNCVKKKARKTELNILWHSTGSPTSLSVFLISSVCLVVHVTMVDKKTGCRLLLASHIGQNLKRKEEKKRKICSKKWYLKRNISCNAHLLKESLGTECFEITPSWCRRVS